MAGYDNFSKSNNAIDAESRDCYPATRLAKLLGVKPSAVRAVLVPAEWHHTSARFNQTEYYDGELLLAVAGSDDLMDKYDASEIDDALDQFAKLKAWKSPSKTAKTWNGCTVRWLEWSGSRKHPKATEESAEDCVVFWSGGKTCVVTPPFGLPFRKGIATRGFDAFDSDGNRLFVA